MHNSKNHYGVRLNLEKTDNLFLGCIYRSPNSQDDNNEKLFRLIKTVCNIKPSHLVIVGDFNVKEINWVDITFAADEAHMSTKCIECIRDCVLFQHVMEQTRFRYDNVPSLLNLIFTNEENMVREPNIYMCLVPHCEFAAFPLVSWVRCGT